MSDPTLIQMIGAALFALAVIHTFSTRFFEHLAHTQPRHAGLWHLLGEVEVVFGFWAMILMLFMFAVSGKHEATTYLDSRNFTEPMFVFAIMVIAGTRSILQFAGSSVRQAARFMPLRSGHGQLFPGTGPCAAAGLIYHGTRRDDPGGVDVAQLAVCGLSLHQTDCPWR